MNPLPFTIHHELTGWHLAWARLELGDVDPEALAETRARVSADVRSRFSATSEISDDAVAQELRRLFRAAGCDPTRHRPSSEALVRRLVKGMTIPEIQPLVDLNNCLSAQLMVPCCVMVEGAFGAEMVWRSGRNGESYQSLRGPFNLEGKPVLVDAAGPLDTPITGNIRVKVEAATTVAWLVAYTPADLAPERVATALGELAEPVGIRAEPFAASA